MSEFKEGLQDGLAVMTALAVTVLGGIILVAILFGLQVWLILSWLAGVKRSSISALKEARVDIGLHTLTDSYQYWYKKFTKKD